MGLLCACLPATNVLIKRCRQRRRRTRHHDTMADARRASCRPGSTPHATRTPPRSGSLGFSDKVSDYYHSYLRRPLPTWRGRRTTTLPVWITRRTTVTQEGSRVDIEAEAEAEAETAAAAAERMVKTARLHDERWRLTFEFTSRDELRWEYITMRELAKVGDTPSGANNSSHGDEARIGDG